MWFAAALLMLSQPSAAEPTPAPPEFRWFGDLAGSCWEGVHPNRLLRDRQCYSTQYDRFIRGTIELTQLGDGATRPRHEGDSIFTWDRARQRMLFYFWGSDGQHGVSEGYFEGDMLIFPQPPASAGQSSGRRTVWRRLDEEHYHVTVQAEQAGRWVDRLEVTYSRSPAAGA